MNTQLTRVVNGERIGKQGQLRLGCSAILLDKKLSKVLLTRRADNGLWCLPGGVIEPGESVTEGCEREVYEETGLYVSVSKLTGVYSNPNHVIVYPDGNMAHVVVLNFEVEFLHGELGLHEEIINVDWFPVRKALKMDLFHGHAIHIRDALTNQISPFVR